MRADSMPASRAARSAATVRRVFIIGFIGARQRPLPTSDLRHFPIAPPWRSRTPPSPAERPRRARFAAASSAIAPRVRSRAVSPRARLHLARAVASDKTDENSPYQVAKRAELYELRIYGAYYVAVAPYTNREQGLASLMGYIEGGNEDERTFPATQPLVMRYVDDGDGDFDKRMELCLGRGCPIHLRQLPRAWGCKLPGRAPRCRRLRGHRHPGARGQIPRAVGHRVARRRTRTRRARCLPARHLRTALLPQAQAQRAHAQGEVGGK